MLDSFCRPVRVRVALSVALVAAAATVLPAAADPGGAAPAVPVLTWEPCGEEFPGAECAVAVVPLDYDDPDGRMTEVALARIPAADQDRRIGSVFVNPGGPGGSGVGLVLGGFGGFLADGLRGRFDVVGFDPRGVAASDPLHCFDRRWDLVELIGDLPAFPYDSGQHRPFFETVRSIAPECLDDELIALHMSTADVARDMDLLRQAVGDTHLTYLGFSYGSYLGNTYANLFPDRIRALVIDGVLDPRLWSSGFQIASDRVATQQEFNEFLRLCDEAGPECAFSTPEGAAARWETLAESLERRPVDIGFPYSYDLLIADATGAMYAPESWDGFADFLDVVADAALGDQTVAAAPASMAREAQYPNGFDAYYGNQCADTEYPEEFLEWLAFDDYAEAGSRFGPLWWWFNAGCAEWPVADDRYTGPWDADTSATALVVGNFFDGVTDLAGAKASARLLDGRLLSYAGWGHTAYGRSDCATRHIHRYLLDGTLPAEGTVCPANPNPFLGDGADERAPLVGLPAVWPPGRG